MPKVLNGKRLTAAEHEQWRAVMDKTGNGAIATSAVQKRRRRRKRDKARRYGYA